MDSRMKSGKTLATWLAIVAAAMVMIYSGCAKTSTDNAVAPGGTGVSPAQVPTVGMNVCANCHYGTAQAWLTGQHGNYESWNPLTFAIVNLAMYNTGFPYFAFDEWDSACYKCHDPLGDSGHLITDVTGNVPRPVIGCESCHGGGANHYGIGAIPFATPDHQRCGQCHNQDFPTGHLAYHPNGANIMEDYESSGHSHSINSHNYITGSATDVKAKCGRCHTAEGFERYALLFPGTTGYTDLGTALDNEPAIANATNIECYTCHDPHTATAAALTRIPASTDINGKPQSSEFNTCASCHQLVNTNATVITDAYHDPAANSHGDLAEVIGDTHAAVPGDTRINTPVTGCATCEIPLIMVKKGDPDACAACHNPHNAIIEINEQWRESGHGDLTGDPWVHYNWDDAASRAACQRCHTSTGFRDMANNPATYHPNNSIFTHLLPATTGNMGQNEALYCWACHTDYKGGLRDPGPFAPGSVASGGTVAVPTYTKYVDMANVNIVFPDIEGSNICLSCHAGRETGGNIYNDATVFTNAGFRNSHYLASASIVFTAAGYEFIGRDYTDPTSYQHKNIGSPAAPGTGAKGSCIGCHMNTPEKHHFEPIERDVTGAITAITSLTCAVCHSATGPGGIMDVATLTNEEDEYKDSLEALRDQLIAKRGFHFSGNNPYFFKAPYVPGWVEDGTCVNNIAVRNWQTGGAQPTPGVCSLQPTTCCFANSTSCGTCAGFVAGAAGTDSGKDNMGAAFNYNLLEHEAAAFVHNRWYAKRLIYDSIDLIDNDAMDHSVVTTLNAYTTEPFKAGAIAYLLTASCAAPDPACRP